MEKRQESRMSTRRPVRLGHAKGVTRNISASGVFFETDVPHAVGNEISFSIDLMGPQGEKLVLNCRGEIVRVEVEGAKVGLAVKTRTSVLKP
jgi:hypothetical protein